MLKTPISSLQELAVKRGYVPVYDCVGITYNKGFAYFVYKVNCKDLIAEGTGTTKKEAKHNAAKNMLSLLFCNKKDGTVVSSISSSAPVTTSNITCFTPTQTHEVEKRNGEKRKDETVVSSVSSSAPVTTSNITCFTPTQTHEVEKRNGDTPSKIKSNPVFINYVGLLQEFCIQQSLKNVSYEVVEERGPPHMRTFTIEARINSLRKSGTALCKKLAKQEAAKYLLQYLKYGHVTEPSNEPTQTNVQQREINTNRGSENFQQIFEERVQKLGVGIEKCESLPVVELTKQAESLFITYSKTKTRTMQNYLIKDSHTLFKTTYNNLISDSMREKMRMICDKHSEQLGLIERMIREIEVNLKVKMQEVKISSYGKRRLICMRLMSRPNITEFGIGETIDKAKSRAMYKIILAILTFLS